MEWERLRTQEGLDDLMESSAHTPQLIFKHSTRCSLSSMAFSRLQSGLPDIGLHIVDVIGDRDISNLIAQKFAVAHQSPQILIIYNKACIYDDSHFNISSQLVNREINLIQEV
jgi:bacillithiol system protein YtxJ